MKVTEITVHASTGFTHPHEAYSNFKPGVTLHAQLTDGENVWERTRALQTLAESLVQAEKQETLARLKVVGSQNIENRRPSQANDPPDESAKDEDEDEDEDEPPWR